MELGEALLWVGAGLAAIGALGLLLYACLKESAIRRVSASEASAVKSGSLEAGSANLGEQQEAFWNFTNAVGPMGLRGGAAPAARTACTAGVGVGARRSEERVVWLPESIMR